MASYDINKTNLHNQTVSKGSTDIFTLSRRVISNEKNHPSRILYAGPNFSSKGMVVYRVIELCRGNNFLEKIVFDATDKSIHSKMIYLQKGYFHKIVDPHVEEFNRVYRKKVDSTISSVSLYRGTESGNIRTNIIVDERKSCLYDFYTFWKLRSYYKK